MIGVAFLLSQDLFAKVYVGNGEERIFSINQTFDGGYAAAGWTEKHSENIRDILVLKIFPDGALEWAKVFGGRGYSEAHHIIQTSDSGFLVVGWTTGFGSGDEDIILLKLDSGGSLEWARTYGTANRDEACSVIQSLDGSYTIVGHISNMDETDLDVLVLKVAPDGALEWARAFGGNDWDEASAIIESPDGGYIIAAHTYSYDIGYGDVFLLKISADGSFQWARTFGTSLWEMVYSIAWAADGGYFMVGYTWGSDSTLEDFLVMEVSPDGSLEWARTVGNGYYDYAYSVVQTPDGGCTVSGREPLIVHFSPDGSLDWAYRFNDYLTDIVGYSTIAAPDSGYVVAGVINNHPMVFKLSPDGSYPGCLERISPIVDTPRFQESYLSYVPASSVDLVVSTPLLSVADASLEVYDLCEPYPGVYQSPAGPSRVLALPAPGGLTFKSQKDIKVNIYSASGRLVRELKLQKGENFIPLKPGVYIWQAGEERGKAAVR